MVDALEEIKSRLTVTDVYGDNLRRSGSGFIMLCPFHDDTKPSLTIFNNDMGFCCFACGEKGDAISFVMKKEHIDFPSALKTLADKVGVTLGAVNNPHAKLYKIMDIARQFYEDELAKNPEAMAYLIEKRGLTHETIKRFHIGYTGRPILSAHLKSLGFTPRELMAAGICRLKSESTVDFYMSPRIICPIIRSGKTLGFSGRGLGSEEPKYLNTPGTEIFSKRDVLYGLDGAEVKKAGAAIVVEGNFDVIMAYQYGFRNICASLGTAFGPGHLQLLSKFCNTVYILFDGDKAGERATLAASKLCFKSKLKGGVVTLPKGEDPDSFFRSGGNLYPLLSQSLPFSVKIEKEHPEYRDFIVRKMLNRNPVEAAEFMSYGSNDKERDELAEMSARDILEQITCRAQVIYEDKNLNIQIRNYNNRLCMFRYGRFVFGRYANGDKKEAALWMVDMLTCPKMPSNFGREKIDAI